MLTLIGSVAQEIELFDSVPERNFTAPAPNRIWLADITYIPTGEGWVYLTAVMDLCNRKIVGWTMRDHLRTELPPTALVMAVQRHRPDADMIHHSDRSQYASDGYRRVMQHADIRASMSCSGYCLDDVFRSQPQSMRRSADQI